MVVCGWLCFGSKPKGIKWVISLDLYPPFLQFTENLNTFPSVEIPLKTYNSYYFVLTKKKVKFKL